MLLTVEVRPNAGRRDAELCRLYWLQPDRPTKKRPFLYTAEELGQRFGLTKVEVGRTVERHCFAYFSERPCDRCGGIVALHIRSDYELHRYGRTVCESCPWEPGLPNVQDIVEKAAELHPEDEFFAHQVRWMKRHAERAEVRARGRYNPADLEKR